jgi:transglutaminase-like putative cysteine protease
MELGFSRRNVGRLALLAWAVALAWLARREFSSGDQVETAQRTTRLGPTAQYFAVMIGGRQIGQLNLAIDTLADGVRLTELLVIDQPLGDSTHQLASSGEYLLSRSLRLRRLIRTVFGGGPQERTEAELGPDSILSVQHVEGSSETIARVRLRVPAEVSSAVMLPYRAAFGGQLSAGSSFAVPLLDLGSGGTRSVSVRVMAESTFVVADSAAWDASASRWVPVATDTVRAWRLDHDAPGAPTVSWVDATGALLHQETAGGVTLVRAAFEIVRNNYRADRRTENSAWRRRIPGMLPLIGSGRIPDTVASRRFVLSSDSGASVSGYSRALTGGRQSLRGDTLTITRATPLDSSEAGARAAAASSGPGSETPTLDEAFATAARAATLGARTGEDSAAGLTRWVARQIVTDSSKTASSTALFTLRSQRGTPDGKARLLVSLARASGIPARVVTGFAVVGGGIFAHAWAELWLGRWVAADPTYGQFPASPALVRISVGGRSRPTSLIPLAGSARFLPLVTPP